MIPRGNMFGMDLYDTRQEDVVVEQDAPPHLPPDSLPLPQNVDEKAIEIVSPSEPASVTKDNKTMCDVKVITKARRKVMRGGGGGKAKTKSTKGKSKQTKGTKKKKKMSSSKKQKSKTGNKKKKNTTKKKKTNNKTKKKK